MIIVSKPEEWPLDLYPKTYEKTENVISNYVVTARHEDGGYLIFHTISWSIYYLTEDEYANIMDNEYLKTYKIILDKSIDEGPIAEEVFARRTQFSEDIKFDHLANVVIFTTTACNARCPYCYEMGVKKKSMTLETAENVVNFIKKHLYTNRTEIRWFGGEPLLNTAVMDYISEGLDNEGIPFNSTMATNAYLLNEENRAKFKKWHLKQIQVSIDGFGEEYNHMRKYTGNDPNPFETVMNNLKQVMDTTDVKITLRVNVSMDNIDTIPDLLGYIQERFKENLDNGSLRMVYVAGIYQITQDPYGRLPEGYQEKMDRFEKDFPYIWHIEEEEKGVIRKGNLSHCSANFGTSLAISADGKLMPCEHYTDEEIIGDVINGVTNHDIEKSWVTMHGENNVFCLENKCPVLPICKHFYKCPLKKTCSTQERMKSKIESVEKSVKTTFKFYLKKKEELENS